MYPAKSCFLTVAYKDGHIHTWFAGNKEKAQAQIGSSVKEFPTVTGCKRWITQQMRKPVVIPENFPVQPVKQAQHDENTAICGHCNLAWDDSIATEYTPAPSGRCPFEYFHK